jgi:acid phosphatase family membrane protein YuiD
LPVHKVLLISAVAWAIAQILKTLFILFQKGRLDFSYFINGGMPSSHSATVAALATSVGMVEGFNSVAFAIAAIFAMVVMYDAASLRRWVGRQSVVLNRIMREIRARRPVTEWEHDLREFVGHTPFQVVIGAVLGIAVAWIWLTIAP